MHNPFRYVVIMRENSLRVAEVEVVAEAAMEYKSEEFSKIYLNTTDKKNILGKILQSPTHRWRTALSSTLPGTGGTGSTG